MSLLRLQNHQLLLTFTVRDLHPPLGVRALFGTETNHVDWPVIVPAAARRRFPGRNVNPLRDLIFRIFRADAVGMAFADQLKGVVHVLGLPKVQNPGDCIDLPDDPAHAPELILHRRAGVSVQKRDLRREFRPAGLQNFRDHGGQAGPRKPPGRKSGNEHGVHRHRAVPEHIDEVDAAPLLAACPGCGGREFFEPIIAQQYQTEFQRRPIVPQFDIEIACCRNCGSRIQGAATIADALGVASTGSLQSTSKLLPTEKW